MFVDCIYGKRGHYCWTVELTIVSHLAIFSFCDKIFTSFFLSSYISIQSLSQYHSDTVTVWQAQANSCKNYWNMNTFNLYSKVFEYIYEHYYILPAPKGYGREIIKRLLYVHGTVCPFVTFFHKPYYITFINKDIFTKFAGNVYGYENISVQNFGLIFKNKMAAIADCFKNIKML